MPKIPFQADIHIFFLCVHSLIKRTIHGLWFTVHDSLGIDEVDILKLLHVSENNSSSMRITRLCDK